jgi:hypothetical protein
MLIAQLMNYLSWVSMMKLLLGYAYGGKVQTKDGGSVKFVNNIATYAEDKVREYLKSEGVQVSQQ